MKKITFEEMNISDAIKKAVADMGFVEATPIQAAAIPVLIEGRDLIGQARTGSGKTAAFAIPIIERIDASLTGLQALVVCPTRELAIQITEEFRKLFKYCEGLAVVAAYGGQDISVQIRALSRNPQIVVGTPGRLIDHMWRGTIRLDHVNFVVLDEADEMLNMGFRDDIEDILSYVPPKRQTAMFSATMSPDIMRLMKRYLQDPAHADTTVHKKDLPRIEQAYCEVEDSRKFDALTALIDNYDLDVSLVFVNSKSKVDDLVSRLKRAGYRAAGIHGGHEQHMREMVMKAFRYGSVKILVATDVAGRGIDVSGIDAVINYDLPRDDEDYTHRIGRTGRAGNAGRSFTFVTASELRDLKRIEKNGGFNIARIDLPFHEKKPGKSSGARSGRPNAERRREGGKNFEPRLEGGRHSTSSSKRLDDGDGRPADEKCCRRPEKYHKPHEEDDGWETDSATGLRYKLI